MSEEKAEPVPAEPNYANMTEEELDRALAGEVPESPAEPAQGTEPEPEQPASVPDESSPVTEKTEPEPEESDAAAEAAILRARLEEFESRQAVADSNIGRYTAEIGFLRKQIRDLQQGLLAQPEPRLREEYEDEPRARETRQPVAESRPDLSSYVVLMAAKNAANEFRENHPDWSEHEAAIAAEITSQKDYLAAVGSSGDPYLATNEVTRVMENAYLKAKAAVKAARVKELTEKRASQIADLERAKKKAAASASSGAPSPAPKPKAFEEMSVDELDAELEKRYGGMPWG